MTVAHAQRGEDVGSREDAGDGENGHGCEQATQAELEANGWRLCYAELGVNSCNSYRIIRGQPSYPRAGDNRVSLFELFCPYVHRTRKRTCVHVKP